MNTPAADSESVALAPASRRRTANAAMKLLAAVGALTGVFAYSAPSHAVQGLFRIAPQNAPHKTFDLPGTGCPYNAGNSPDSLRLYSHDNTCGNGDQRWYIADMGNGQHEIRQGSASGRCLDIDNGGSGSRLGTYTCTGGSNQRWYFTEEVNGGADGLYGLWKITSVRDGRAIDLDAGNTANGTVIQMWANVANNTNQRWALWGGGGMHSDFEDDFNGTSLNTGNWTAASFGAGRFNNENQYYVPQQVRVENGHLTIVANYNAGCNGGTGMGCYASGRVTSKWKKWNRNGMWSARIKYFEGGSGPVKGTWPAWWLLGNNINEDPYNANSIAGSCWPMSGARELDVWEWVRNNNGASYINNAIQGGSCNGAYHQSVNTGWGWNWSDQIIASVKIDGGRVKFYRNGVKTHDVPDSGFANEDFAMVFNLAVGGMLGGDHRDFNGTDDWASIDVDWVTHETW